MSLGTGCDRCFLWSELLVLVHEIRNDPGHPSHGAATEKRWCVDCVMTYWTEKPYIESDGECPGD